MAKSAESSKTAPESAPSNPDIDEQLHSLWQKYGQVVVIACCAVLLYYVGRAGWGYVLSQKEANLQQEFAAAKTPDQLRSFASAHAGHKLAAVAEVELADQSYASGQIGAALAAYQDAIPQLKGDPLEARAKLGLAMCQVQSGQAVEGKVALKSILDDATQFPVMRVEAGYELASLAAADGQLDQAQKIAAQLLQIDPNSPWTSKAFSLKSATPAK